MLGTYKRRNNGYSLIELMTVIGVLGIVMGLLYAYSEQGWKLFYQSYGRGLSQVKAKLAIRILSQELKEANKARLTIGQGNTYGIPMPEDAKDNTSFIYFTKPKFYESTGDIIAYDYVLYYFAKPKESQEPSQRFDRKRRISNETEFTILKSIKYLEQSKYYTEDESKSWPFMPPIIEISKSRLPEDDTFLETLKAGSEQPTTEPPTGLTEASFTSAQTTTIQYEDQASKLKAASRKIPISGNFLATTLTNPFTKEEASIFFNQNYTADSPIKIKVSLQEAPNLFVSMPAQTEFEVAVTPRN